MSPRPPSDFAPRKRLYIGMANYDNYDGAYAPESAEGRRLIGHELAHVVQQSAGTALQH